LDWNALIRVYLEVPQKSLNTFKIINTIINEIIPLLPIGKRVLMEVIHLLFVEENKQQSNTWCDSYRYIESF